MHHVVVIGEKLVGADEEAGAVSGLGAEEQRQLRDAPRCSHDLLRQLDVDEPASALHQPLQLEAAGDGRRLALPPIAGCGLLRRWHRRAVEKHLLETGLV